MIAQYKFTNQRPAELISLWFWCEIKNKCRNEEEEASKQQPQSLIKKCAQCKHLKQLQEFNAIKMLFFMQHFNLHSNS